VTKLQEGIKVDSKNAGNISNWQCDDCIDNIAVCYCCKQKG